MKDEQCCLVKEVFDAIVNALYSVTSTELPCGYKLGFSVAFEVLEFRQVLNNCVS